MKSIFYSFFCASMFFGLIETAFGRQPVGSVTHLEGSAKIVGKNETPRDCSVGGAVFTGDNILTERNSKLRISMNDGSVLDQGEKSHLVIDEYVYNPKKPRKNKAYFSVVKGVLRLITGEITKLNPERFSVQTGMATVGIRGSHLLFKVKEDGSLEIFIIQASSMDDISISTRWEVQNGENAGNIVQNTSTIGAAGLVITIGRDGRMHTEELTLDRYQTALREATPLTAGNTGDATTFTPLADRSLLESEELNREPPPDTLFVGDVVIGDVVFTLNEDGTWEIPESITQDQTDNSGPEQESDPNTYENQAL